MGSKGSYADLNDKWLFALVYPIVPFFVVHVGNDNSFNALLRNPTYYSDLALGMICTYLTGFYLRAIHAKYRSPGKLPFGNILSKTMILFAFFLPLGVIIVIEAFYLEWMLGIRLKESSIFYLELPLAATILAIINLVYALLHANRRHLSTTHSLKNLAFPLAEPVKYQPATYKESFLVTRGASTLNIPLHKVAFFITSSKITYLVTDENEKYMYGESIENLGKTLNPALFFQLNRQIIANRDSVKGYEQTNTRKLDIQLHPRPAGPVYVSKERATKFTRWLQAVEQSD